MQKGQGKQQNPRQGVVVQCKQKVKIPGRGVYELTYKNIMNPMQMKQLTSGVGTIDVDYIRALKHRKEKIERIQNL